VYLANAVKLEDSKRIGKEKKKIVTQLNQPVFEKFCTPSISKHTSTSKIIEK